MGNYRQHLTFASGLGVFYAFGIYVLSGVHWIFGTVAAMLTTIGGLLPDLDHPTGTELKGFTGILAVLASVAVWHKLARRIPDLPFELHLIAVVLVYILIRHWMRGVLARMMVHRGILHSFPCCAVWGASTYLYYPSDNDLIRIIMSASVMLGFLSHLLLDEMFSVDLHNTRIKRSFGSAMKFWAPSLPATIAMYGILSVVAYQVIQVWPDRSIAQILAERPPRIVVTWPPEAAGTPSSSEPPPTSRDRNRNPAPVVRSPVRRGPGAGRTLRWGSPSE